MICTDLKERYDIRNIKTHPFFNGEILKEKRLRKIKMSSNEFKTKLEKNYEKFFIKNRKDKKMFLSKFGNNLKTPIHKNYEKIEKSIVEKNFDFDLFD